MNTDQKIYCGIDVSKKHLDAFIQGKTVRFANTITGITRLMKHDGAFHYVFESTGGYERLAAWHLLGAGKTVSIVNPSRVREYAKSIGQIAKTDQIDAQIITRFAELVRPRETELPSKEQRRLTILVERRKQLIDMRVAETSRLDTAGEPEARKMIKKHCQWLEKQTLEVEQSIENTISNNDEMSRKAERMQLIKGLGNVTISTLLAVMPEIGSLSRQEVAALAGVAPYNRDSGMFKGRRHIYGGRKHLRSCLYMAAVSASRSNPHLKSFYHHLVEENHRPKKVALTAVMRKLIIAANSAAKNPDFLVAA
jgi:transposase